jgi:hypothetical protein
VLQGIAPEVAAGLGFINRVMAKRSAIRESFVYSQEYFEQHA